jgi:chloramphenicol 3-O-phosphotransferase
MAIYGAASIFVSSYSIPMLFSTKKSASNVASKKRGAFILFEGLDRCGKTSQSIRLAENLQKKRALPVAHMRFPERTTAIGKMLNAYLTNNAELDDHSVCLQVQSFKLISIDSLIIRLIQIMFSTKFM